MKQKHHLLNNLQESAVLMLNNTWKQKYENFFKKIEKRLKWSQVKKKKNEEKFQNFFENKKVIQICCNCFDSEQNLPGQARSRGRDQKTDGSSQPDVGTFS